MILSHGRDYSNFGLHETVLFLFSRLFTKAEEGPSEKADRKQQERSVAPS